MSDDRILLFAQLSKLDEIAERVPRLKTLLANIRAVASNPASTPTHIERHVALCGWLLVMDDRGLQMYLSLTGVTKALP